MHYMQMFSLCFTFFFLSFLSVVSAEDSVQLQPYKRHLQLTGFTKAKAELSVAGEISGRCIKLLVDQGDSISSSGLVAELDSTFIRLELTKNNVAREQAGLQLELEKKNLSRYTSLMKSNSAAEATLDEASLRADLLELSLKSLKNEEMRLQQTFERHFLRGPPGWQVIERFIEVGAFVGQGEPVMRLGDFRELLVPLLLSHEELELLYQMETIVLWFPELETKATGRIYRVSPDFDKKSRKIPVELIISQSGFEKAVKLRGGLRATLTIVGKYETGSFVIPTSALVSRYEAHWLIQTNGERKKVILLGTDEDGQLAIVAGEELAAGEFFLLFPKGAKRNQQAQQPDIK